MNLVLSVKPIKLILKHYLTWIYPFSHPTTLYNHSCKLQLLFTFDKILPNQQEQNKTKQNKTKQNITKQNIKHTNKSKKNNNNNNNNKTKHKTI